MSVHDITGRLHERQDPDESPMDKLAATVAGMQKIGMKLDKFYLIAEFESPDDGTRVICKHEDSGLTVAEAVFMLEKGKAAILAAMERT